MQNKIRLFFNNEEYLFDLFFSSKIKKAEENFLKFILKIKIFRNFLVRFIYNISFIFN